MLPEEQATSGQGPSDDVHVLTGQQIWINRPKDCHTLQRLCLLPGAWERLSQISQGKSRIDNFNWLIDDQSSLNLSNLEKTWEQLTYNGFDSTGTPLSAVQIDERLTLLDDDKKILHLFDGLKILRETWESDSTSDALVGLLAFSSGPGLAEIAIDSAALVIHPGSLTVEFGWKTRYAATFALTLVTRRGRVDSQIADDLVKRLRDRGNWIKLPTVSDVTPADISGKKGLIVFLHGLASTDAGLFDSLIIELKKDKTFEQAVVMLSYPHDSFNKIETNASQLLDRLGNLLPKEAETRLMFVGHSRGGLLARKIAAGLYDADPKRWRTQLAGCVTFGTPHYGTPLAEYPSQLLGLGVCAIGAQTGGFATASDVLALVRAYEGKIPGISDLKSPKAIGEGVTRYNFILELRELERRLAGREDCILPILAIGGRGPHNSRIGWVTNRMFRGVENDCAVELSSSAHPEIPKCTSHEVQSDHFSYFKNGMGFEEAISFIDECLGHERRIAAQRPIQNLRRSI